MSLLKVIKGYQCTLVLDTKAPSAFSESLLRSVQPPQPAVTARFGFAG